MKSKIIFFRQPVLLIEPVRLDSEGIYLCQASNMLGEGEATSMAVKVEQEPRIVSGLQERVLRKSGDTGIVISHIQSYEASMQISWSQAFDWLCTII